jgi:hypothetical protein
VDKTPVPYVFQAWPAYRYGPNGQSAIFQSAEEVPDGWQDHPNKVGGSPDVILDDNDDRVAKLIADNTAEDLIGHLELMQEQDQSIEFHPKWPKLRLAKTIVAFGGPLED